MSAYQMYRETTLGNALQQTLDEMIQDGSITPALALRVMTTFDRAINKALAQRIKTKIVFKANQLKAYRFCDNVWTFLMEKVEFRETNSDGFTVDQVKFVACDGKAPGATTATGSAAT